MSKATTGTVLIVDDEEHIRDILEAALAPVAKRVLTAENAEVGLEKSREENIDVVVCDIQMPGMSGLEFLRKVTEEQPEVRFLMITAFASIETVVKALRYGASDFITKPFENSQVRQVVQNLLQSPVKSKAAIISPDGLETSQYGIIGNSEAIHKSIKMATKAAQSDSVVILLGESGTGKDVFARAIHQMSKRKDAPYIPINCGALPENLAESELFGHERGSFTGALEKRPGKFTLAHTGTLFLDEIGDLPLDIQVKLLRVLQDKIVEPIGSSRPQKVDIRLIAATNKNLEEAIKKGNFREDLYYRLNIIPIVLPPLRERAEDILLLADFFLKRFCTRYEVKYQLSRAQKESLLAYTWPGNVRELENVIERSVVLSENGTLDLQLPEQRSSTVHLQTEVIVGVAAKTTEDVISSDPFSMQRKTHEKTLIVEALEKQRWNKTRTAEDLGISRRSLLYKIKEFGIQ